MAQQNIDFGTFPDDPNADAIRTAFGKVQNNFNELFTTSTSGSVTSINRIAGAGIQVNSPTGNVIVTANIACVQVATSTLSIGVGGNGASSAVISNTAQVLFLDINPANVFSANFAAVGGGLANLTGTLTSAASSQPNITSAANLTTIGTLSSLTVTGNITSGNVSGTLLTGTLTTASQPNITTIGTLGNLTVTSNSTLGNTATANFFVGDGGLLTNVSVSAGSALYNGTSNLVVRLNSDVTISAGGTANVITATSTGANVTGYLTASGNVTATNASLGNAVTANYFIGSGANISGIVGANVTGTVANATYAITAGTAYAVSAGNITGTINLANYATTANSVAGANVSGAVTYATTANSVAGANVSGEVANATYATSAGTATSATTAGVVTTAAQPNITSVGTLSSLTVTANTTSGNVYANSGIVKGQYLYGDGSNITNISISAGSSIVNGTSNVSIPASDGNVNTVVAGNTTLVVTGTGVNVNGTLNATGTISGNFNGNVTRAAQGNITSVGTLTGLTVNGVTNLGGNGNVIITGGSTNTFLMTNGSGNLSWVSAALAPVPGSNTEVIFNDSGSYGASSSLTFNNITGLLTSTLLQGTLNANSNSQANITEVGTLKYLVVSSAGGGTGNINAGNITGTHYGAATGLTSIPGANVSGTVANATYATSAGTATSATTAGVVTTAAQPNITSVGTLANLSVGNTITANDASLLSVVSSRTGISVTTDTVIDTFPVNSYRVAKYTMRVSDNTGYQALEVLLVHSGINSIITVYGSLSTTNEDLITVTSDISAGNVNVYATAIGSSTSLNLLGTYVPD